MQQRLLLVGLVAGLLGSAACNRVGPGSMVAIEPPPAYEATLAEQRAVKDDFFRRALAREPDFRFASAREMALAFSRITPITFTTLSMPDPKEIEKAIAEAKAGTVVVMCAEASPWHCDRSFLADALDARGVEVLHLIDDARVEGHRLNPLARVEDTRVKYPGLL